VSFLFPLTIKWLCVPAAGESTATLLLLGISVDAAKTVMLTVTRTGVRAVVVELLFDSWKTAMTAALVKTEVTDFFLFFFVFWYT
jgi:hypothetical protein